MKKIISFITIFALLLTITGINEIAYAIDIGEGATVTEVTVGKRYNSNLEIEYMYVLIKGSGLKDKEVYYLTPGYGATLLTNRTLNTETILQFDVTSIENQFTGDVNIKIGDVTIPVDFSEMPTLKSVDKKTVNVDENDDLTIEGTNLDKINTSDSGIEYKGFINDADMGDFITNSSDSELELTDPKPEGEYGLQDIIFKKIVEEVPDTSPAVTVEYRYEDQFSYIKNISIDGFDMYPNRGAAGSTLYFTGTDMNKYSAFLLKDLKGEEYKFTNENKTKFINLVPDGDKNILSVEVPDLPTGEYYVMLTNPISDGEDPEENITDMFLVPDKFTIINEGNKMQIISVDPQEGPDTGEEVAITGKYFGTLNIDELVLDDSDDYTAEIEPDLKDELTITYNSNATYKGEVVSNLQRKVIVIIGNKQQFVNEGSFGTFDELYVNAMFDSANSEPVQDVIIETETTFTCGGKDYRFIERAELKNGYEFIPSSVTPEVTNISPNFIEVEQDGVDYKTKHDILLAIQGNNNFMVYREYDEDTETTITRYPIVRIKQGTSTEIEINKNTNQILDKNGNVFEKEGQPVEPEIYFLDDNGEIVDGSQGNQAASKIVLYIPKGVIISQPIPNPASMDLEVVNPVMNSSDEGLKTVIYDAINFVEVLESPIISSVNPNVINVEGGEQIEIIGSNFKEGVKVFLDGQEIEDITRQGDGKKITFTAPPGREARTQLLVMNPDGGMDVHEFIYVKTYTEPRIDSISPQEGMADTLAVIKGDNLLKTDPTATSLTDLGIQKLIGTKVLLDGEDINRYNKPLGKIELQDYTPEVGKEIIRIEDNKLKVADYYYSVVLQQEDLDTAEVIDNFYTLTIQPDGTPIISDGVNDEYTIELDGSEIKAKTEGKTYTLDIQLGHIIFNDGVQDTLKLRIRTLYEIEDGEITGNRVKVNSRNELYFYVPNLVAEGYYDVTIVNPDTKSYTVEDGFYYFKSPNKKPMIDTIEPSQGSTEGGYYIEIIGQDFYDNGTKKTSVYIGGIKVNDEDVIVSTDNTSMKVKVPPYPGDIREELGLDRKTVPVVVVNPDGGSDYKEDGFTYIIPTSHPEIDLLSKTEGKAAGGDYVQIIGSDFRFYEPFIDLDGDAVYDPGTEEYTDVNGNGQFDDITGLGIVEDLTEQEKILLPNVYFGDNSAEIIEYADGYLLVKTPDGEIGKVDVYVVNNDFGVSNKKSFNYVPSDPKIEDIVPNEGTRLGGDTIEIYGEEFVKSKIEVYEEDVDGNIVTTEKDMVLVRFGDNTNLEDEESGNIVSGKAKVELDGGLTVDYDSIKNKLIVTIKEKDKEYTREYNDYDDTDKFIDVTTLKNVEDSSNYSRHEYIRIRVEDRRLLVERGYSPEVVTVYEDTLEVLTPSYHLVGPVPVTVINPDKQTAEGQFTYKSPDSNPIITSITPIHDEVLNEATGEIDHYEIQSVIEGGILLTIEGSDFRRGVKVMVGSEEAEIVSKSNDDDKIIIRSPKGREIDINKLLKIVVINEDGGMVDSVNSTGLEHPIYYKYLPTITEPIIESVTPNKGSAGGGEWIEITGNNFRVGPGEIEVRIGGKLANIDYDQSRYDKLVVRTPSSDYLGPVDVYVKNTLELGEAVLKDGFTYYSNPQITDVTPDEVHITGGQKVIIEGRMFLEGVKVYFDDTPVSQVTFLDENTIEVVTPEGEEGYKDIKIENTDGGMCVESDGIKYILPIPETPRGFDAEPGHERSIVLTWDEVEGADRYKIYGREKGEDDYKFIAETTELEYYLKDLEPDTKYYFKLWALNEYGESEDYDYARATTLETDEDEENEKYEEYEEIKQEGTEDTKITYSSGEVLIDLPLEYSPWEYNVDLTDSKYKDIEELQINIPLSVINRGAGSINLKTKEVLAHIPISSIWTSVYYIGTGQDEDDANVIIKISKLSKAEKSRITKSLNRREKAISEGYKIELILQVSRTTEKLQLNDDINFGILIDNENIDKNKLYLAKFNPELNKLQENEFYVSQVYKYDYTKTVYNVYGEIKKDGKFIVIYKK
ncbi:IPT/TIG domain-containing protein [Caldisalinibacter kiritimatiensis]|uniref:Flagellar hook-length control protein FliK n=1 Tax=Caldisalinibacter kiritimatiensis TaxID=1304284 RepID=R1CT81_9FIRM|nr:IPT/TIG domain-containing protein [Caldisalinibacter kiritimatiensis]EOD01856.1 Flagellar hook-length control protein FliK [Caldisalinibacter kiritimatiensis]